MTLVVETRCQNPGGGAEFTAPAGLFGYQAKARIGTLTPRNHHTHERP